MSSVAENLPPLPKPPARPFRRAILRGLAVVMPPLLTLALFAWVTSAVDNSVLQPMASGTRTFLTRAIADIRTDLPDGKPSPDDATIYTTENESFKKTARGKYVPLDVYETVSDEVKPDATADEIYRAYVAKVYLPTWKLVPVVLVVFVLALYVLGKFLAAGIGRVVYISFERAVHRLPLVSNVYSSVKQVTDFFLTEREIEYTRVIAVEYPRKGIWSLGLVTGESMMDISAAANEAVLSVLIPSSPMPITGYTITIKKSEAIDLNISIDQALQFVVSCGVVVPPQQIRPEAQAESLLAHAASSEEAGNSG